MKQMNNPQLINAIALPTIQGGLDSFDLLLDTEASVPVIRNAALLRNIRPAQDPVHVDGIGGQLIIHTVGDLDDFGVAYHHPDALANVLSFASVEDIGKITYIQRESCFKVLINGNTYVFRRIAHGSGKNLYACNMRQHARGRPLRSRVRPDCCRERGAVHEARNRRCATGARSLPAPRFSIIAKHGEDGEEHGTPAGDHLGCLPRSPHLGTRYELPEGHDPQPEDSAH